MLTTVGDWRARRVILRYPRFSNSACPVAGPVRPDAPPAVIRFRPSGLNRKPMTQSGASISRRIDKSAGFHSVIFPFQSGRGEDPPVGRPFDPVKFLRRGLEFVA